jgi:hypothetical protein
MDIDDGMMGSSAQVAALSPLTFFFFSLSSPAISPGRTPSFAYLPTPSRNATPNKISSLVPCSATSCPTPLLRCKTHGETTSDWYQAAQMSKYDALYSKFR